MNWKTPPPRWDTLAGQVLDAFFAAVHETLPDFQQPLTIFGASGTGRAGSIRASYGVQIYPPQLFRPTPHYLQRAHVETRHGLKIVVPHLQDILIAKLHRARVEAQQGLVPKDRRAFQRVRELSGGHPSLDELLADMVICEPCFRPPQDGGVNAFRLNAEDVLLELYAHSLDLKRDIIEPALIASQPPGQSPADFLKAQSESLND